MFEPGSASQTGGAGEVAAELLPNATERLLAAVGGQLVEQARNERRKATGRNLEGVRLRRRRIELRGPARAGAVSAGAARELGLEQPRLEQPFEPAASDAPVNVQGNGRVVGRHRPRRAAYVEQGCAQLWGRNPVEAVHPREILDRFVRLL